MPEPRMPVRHYLDREHLVRIHNYIRPDPWTTPILRAGAPVTLRKRLIEIAFDWLTKCVSVIFEREKPLNALILQRSHVWSCRMKVHDSRALQKAAIDLSFLQKSITRKYTRTLRRVRA